jgi:bacteriocin-like protein
MQNLNEKELREINGGYRYGCGNGDGVIFNPNNHGPLVLRGKY